MISICTSSPADFSDNAVYVVSHVLRIEQLFPFVTLLNLWKEHAVYCSYVVVIRKAESNSGCTSESLVY